MIIKRRKCFLVTTKHLEEALWFRDDEDFKTGMNHVAVQTALMPEVILLAYILMSNHVHFVLRGTWDEVVAYVNSYKGRFSRYLNRKYGTIEFFRRNALDIKELPEDEPEALERALAYVQMNCVAANICLYPGQYPWGTGNSFFVDKGTVHHYRRLGDLSERTLIRLLHSGDARKLPKHWLLSDAGYVLPSSYVATKTVEAIFRSPKRMLYYLNTSSKARKRLEAEEENMPAFRDQVILSALPDLLQSLFQKSSFSALSLQQQAEALRQIRFRFSAGIHQAARVCGITYADAAHLLDTA